MSRSGTVAKRIHGRLMHSPLMLSSGTEFWTPGMREEEIGEYQGEREERGARMASNKLSTQPNCRYCCAAFHVNTIDFRAPPAPASH